VLTPGVSLLSGYSSPVTDYVIFRQSDAALSTPFEPGGTQNWVQTLFSGTRPFVDTSGGQALLAASGNYASSSGTTSFTVNAAPAAPSITSGNAPTFTVGTAGTFTVGTAGTFTVTATGSPAPTFSKPRSTEIPTVIGPSEV